MCVGALFSPKLHVLLLLKTCIPRNNQRNTYTSCPPSPSFYYCKILLENLIFISQLLCVPVCKFYRSSFWLCAKIKSILQFLKSVTFICLGNDEMCSLQVWIVQKKTTKQLLRSSVKFITHFKVNVPGNLRDMTPKLWKKFQAQWLS